MLVNDKGRLGSTPLVPESLRDHLLLDGSSWKMMSKAIFFLGWKDSQLLSNVRATLEPWGEPQGEPLAGRKAVEVGGGKGISEGSW